MIPDERTRPLLIVALACATLLTGCISSEQLAVERASVEFDCPKSKIKATYLNTISKNYDGFFIYRVNACGNIATYECSEYSGCEKESNGR